MPAASGERRAVPGSLPIAAYAVLGVVVILPAWVHGASHTLQGGGGGDNGQEVWFLAWAAHAVTHLENPLRTNWVNYPWGADLADNTSMPLAGILGTPVTLLFGPIAAYNLLISCAFASSASAAFYACRRWSKTTLAPFVGGLLYGFSPYMIGQRAGHLFLLLAAVPPLALIALDEVLIRQRWAWWASGLALGGLCLVQLGWSVEMFAGVALVAAVGVALLGASRRHLVMAKLPYAARALAAAAVVTVPVVAVFVVTARTGPEHPPGAVHPVSLLAGLSSQLASLIAPTTSQLITFGHAAFGSSLVALTPPVGPPTVDVSESGAYLGIPLLLFLAIGVWRLRRDALLRFAVVMAATSFLLSMGSRFRWLGHATSVPLPFALLTHLPLVDSEVASRYTLFMWLFVALATSVILDRSVLRAFARPARGHARRRAPAVPVVPTLLLTAGMLALVPAPPWYITNASIPRWFTSAAERRVPEGSVLLTYPYAVNSHNLPMLWQAVDGLRYRIPDGELTLAAHRFGALNVAFDSCWNHPGELVPRRYSRTAAGAELRTWHVETVVVPVAYSINPACALRVLESVVGFAPTRQFGAYVWNLRGR